MYDHKDSFGNSMRVTRCRGMEVLEQVAKDSAEKFGTPDPSLPVAKIKKLGLIWWGMEIDNKHNYYADTKEAILKTAEDLFERHVIKGWELA